MIVGAIQDPDPALSFLLAESEGGDEDEGGDSDAESSAGSSSTDHEGDKAASVSMDAVTESEESGEEVAKDRGQGGPARKAPRKCIEKDKGDSLGRVLLPTQRSQHGRAKEEEEPLANDASSEDDEQPAPRRKGRSEQDTESRGKAAMTGEADRALTQTQEDGANKENDVILASPETTGFEEEDGEEEGEEVGPGALKSRMVGRMKYT